MPKSTKKKELTPKQSKFSRLVADGKSLSDAYRESYNVANMKPATINHAACKLMANSKITARVKHLNAQRDENSSIRAVSEREQVMSRIRNMADNATPQDGNKIRATELWGKSIALFTDVVIDKTPRSSADIKQELVKRLALIQAEATQTDPNQDETSENQRIH